MSQITTIRQYVPQQIQLNDWSQLQPLYEELQQRELRSVAELEQWLSDFSELSAAVSEYGARVRVDQACHTDDPQRERVFLDFIENVAPHLKRAGFALQKKLFDTGLAEQLDPKAYEVLLRDWRNDVELYREANVPLQTQLTRLASEYDKLVGAMLIEYEGKEYTPQQLARFLEEPDRQVREQTWTMAAERRLKDREPIEKILDEQIELRQQMAANADEEDYRAYAWKMRGRFDYGPADCLKFAEAIEKVCVPRVAALDREQRDALGVESLRPWDAAVDPQGRPPLRPFDPDDPEQFKKMTAKVLGRIAPDLAEEFSALSFERNLDLDSRPGKRAGGFQAALQESGEPFIFMNAAGTARDVEVLIHEAGHALHFVWSHRAIPLVFHRHGPIEFCEVASMGLELLAYPFLDEFYKDEGELARARRRKLEGIIRFFPWMAIIDGFQHWLYTNPGHSHEQRRQAWNALLDRFYSPGIDWAGHEDFRDIFWQVQIHLFHHPFYYVEYGIAQLGALQLWAQYREDPEQALTRYRQALKLGGTRPLPELFEAAGLSFSFDEQTLEPLIDMLYKELDALPE